jgi:hypothetical protein
MTEPANLPARPPDPTGPTGVPLSRTPTEALAFALGFIAASPVSAEQYGGVCALVEELMRRSMPVPDVGEVDTRRDGSVWNQLMIYMPPQLARSIQMLYLAHRGQRWARSGRR